ncbi:hypothetical protein [Pseudonocardia zijingensis]|uniref:Uncharacterized protein n=1 Tax=Pseudonocardia zijingensis TaxID=153376 RepID=A0ABN1PHC0_9PSEU
MARRRHSGGSRRPSRCSTSSTFNGAELAAGGKGGGRICFEDPGLTGTYQVLYDGWFQGEEQAWETSRG